LHPIRSIETFLKVDWLIGAGVGDALDHEQGRTNGNFEVGCLLPVGRGCCDRKSPGNDRDLVARFQYMVDRFLTEIDTLEQFTETQGQPGRIIGVLTEIDVRRTLREKLGVAMEPYLILGACNPPLAHRALEQEPEVGLLLSCNVVVRVQGQGSRVEIADPQAMLGIVGNPHLDALAAEARQRLQRVISSLEQFVSGSS
jgi:uncharacterized protein (DUF302 family)